MKGKKLLALMSLLFLISSTHQSLAQSPIRPLPEDPRFKERLVYGGSFWFFLGQYSEIEVLPLIGYRQTNRLSFLAGPMYSYSKLSGTDIKSQAYGARILSRFFVTNSIYLQGEIDNLTFVDSWSPDFRPNITYQMVGAGYYNYGGTLELMYIINNPINSHYRVPFIIRAGFIID